MVEIACKATASYEKGLRQLKFRDRCVYTVYVMPG